jgi:hypothetical protein
LRDEENARAEYAAKCEKLEAELQTQTKLLADREFEIHKLHERLTALLQQRAEIEDLRQLLEEWKDEEEYGDDDDGDGNDDTGYDGGDDDQFGRQSVRSMLEALTRAVQKAGYAVPVPITGAGAAGIAEEKFDPAGSSRSRRIPGSASSASRKPQGIVGAGYAFHESSPFPQARSEQALYASAAKDNAENAAVLAALQALSPALLQKSKQIQAAPLHLQQSQHPSFDEPSLSFQVQDRQRQLEEQITLAAPSADPSLLASVDVQTDIPVIQSNFSKTTHPDQFPSSSAADDSRLLEDPSSTSGSTSPAVAAVALAQSTAPISAASVASPSAATTNTGIAAEEIPSAALQSPSSGAAIGVSKSPKWHTRELL